MATIVILEHAHANRVKEPYLLYTLAKRWKDAGHVVKRHRGTAPGPRADVAIMNVDLTVIPEEYRKVAARYPTVVNGAVHDVSKRRFSELLVDEDSDYDGPVIVKTNANSGGRMDRYLTAGDDAGTRVVAIKNYRVFDSVRKVPRTVWDNRQVIVEKFIPEQDAHGFYLRHWVFFGDQERSVRYRAAVSVIKSRDMIERLPAEVPDEIREWRKRLRFDFGKFDYVKHEGRYVLLDVNATPTSPAQGSEDVEASRDVMAGGIDMFLNPVTA